MPFLSDDIVRKERSIVAKSIDSCLLCRAMEKLRVSVPLDSSAWTAEECANWSTTSDVSEGCGFARLRVSPKPGGNFWLWRVSCRDTGTGADPAPAEPAMNWNSGILELNCLHAVCFVCLWTVLVSCFQFWECHVSAPSAQVQLHLGSMFQKSSYDASALRLALEAVQLPTDCDYKDCLDLWWLYARHSVQVSYHLWHKYSAYGGLRAGYIKMINNKQEKCNSWCCSGFFLAFFSPPVSLACIYKVSPTKELKFWSNETMLSEFCHYGVPLNFCFTVDVFPLWTRFKKQEFLWWLAILALSVIWNNGRLKEK